MKELLAIVALAGALGALSTPSLAADPILKSRDIAGFSIGMPAEDARKRIVALADMAKQEGKSTSVTPQDIKLNLTGVPWTLAIALRTYGKSVPLETIALRFSQPPLQPQVYSISRTIDYRGSQDAKPLVETVLTDLTTKYGITLQPDSSGFAGRITAESSGDVRKCPMLAASANDNYYARLSLFDELPTADNWKAAQLRKCGVLLHVTAQADSRNPRVLSEFTVTLSDFPTQIDRINDTVTYLRKLAADAGNKQTQGAARNRPGL